jgi:hypothetical protein
MNIKDITFTPAKNQTTISHSSRTQTNQYTSPMWITGAPRNKYGPGSGSLCSDWLRAGRSGDRIPVGGEILRTCPDRPWGPPSLLYNGYRVFPGVKSGRGVTLIPQPLLVPWSWKSRAIPLLTLWAVRPVQSLSACTRVHFTFFLPETSNDLALNLR